ncbi:hypothetical protein NHJ13051_005606 [Beauveria bassiana]
MDPSDDWSQRADSGRGDPAPPLSTPSTPPVAKTRKYQAYVASESGSCQRSGDSPRSEPAEYWDDEEEDDWADDSGDAIGPDDSASIRINRQCQQTRPPPPVRHHSSPPRPQHRFPSVPGPPSSVLSDDEPPYYGPQGHNASRFPHGYRESYGRGVRAHPPVNPPAPLRDRFTRAPALPADGYYAPGYGQTIGYSQPLRYNPGHGQSFGYSHRSAPWYGPRPSYPQSTASGYGSPLRHNSQYPGNLPALGDYFNTGAYPSQGTYYGGDPRGYYGDLRGYYDDPRGCYSSPAIGEYNTTPYEAGKNPFAPTSSHFNIPPPPPPPPPPPAEFPTAAPPPPPPMTPPPPPGPRAEEYQTTSSAGEAAAEPAAAVPQAPTCTGLDIQAPQRLTFDPLIAQTASRIVRTIEVTVAPHGLEKPTLAVTEPTAMAWLQPHTICQEDNATTELLAIQALEHFEDGSGRSNVTLVSMPEAVTEAKKETSVIQMRWLHAKRQALSLDYLVRLISHCPSDILSYDLKQVALSLLEDGCQNLQHRVDNGKIIEAGAMLRYTGIYAEDAKKETDPVIFLSVPYLLLKEKTRRVAGQEGFESLTLLQFLYGYVMGDEPEGKQVVNKINRSLARKMVHVPQLWCLLIGPSILVTLADCALTEIQHGGITVDRRRYSARGDSCLVRVTDLDEEEIKFVIPRNCSLLTLTTQLALLVRRKYSLDQFDLLGEDGQPLDSEAWISLMSEAPEEVMMLIRAKGWKEANESERAQAASQATPSQYGIVPYRQSYRNHFPNMIQSASAQQFMPSYPPPNFPADFYRQPEPYNTSAANPFSPLRSYHGNPFTPMSAAAANPFTPMSAATVTPFTPMSATTANPVVPIPSSRAYKTAPPASDNEMQSFRAPPGEAGTSISREIYRQRAASKSFRKPQAPPGKIEGRADVHTTNKKVSKSKVMFRLATTTDDSKSEPEDAPQAVQNHSSEKAEIGNSVGAEFNYPPPAVDPGIASRRRMTDILLGAETLSTPDAHLRTTEDNRIIRFKEEEKIPNNLSLQTPRLYVQKPNASGAGHDATDKHKDDNSSLSGDSVDFQITACSSVDDNHEVAAQNEGQTGEEDDVVQLKAVWVSDPSRVDPESLRKSEEDGSGKEARVEKPNDEASRPHEGKARGQSKVPSSNATITKLPFFTWKTSLCDAKDDSMKDIVINRLLENANENLVARELVGKLYDKAYMCSPLHFEERHHDWMKLPSPVLSPMDDLLSQCVDEHISVALPTDVGGPTEITSQIAVECTDGVMDHVSTAETIDEEFYLDGTFILTHDGDEDEDSENRSVQTPVSSSCHVPSNSKSGPDVDRRHQDARKIKKPSRKHVKDAVRVEPKMLADLSTDIFGLFIPAELWTIHPLTERYWGSLDRIFRQIKFAIEDIDSKRLQKWCICKFHITPSLLVQNGESSKPPPMAFGECTDCTKSRTYDTAYEALSHIHQLHTNCPGETRYKHVFDDPCYVWLRPTHRKHDGRRYNEIARLTQNFISELRGLCHRATDLQLAVASVDGASSAFASMPSSSSATPSLTKDLVDAFEDIVMAHIIKAKHLSLANQWMFDDDDPNNGRAAAASASSARRTPSAEFLAKVEDMIRCGAECLARAHRCLDHARTNLILLSTRTAMGAKISLDYIGIEFLVAVLVGHLQHQGINAESHPEALLELYQKYTAKLQFEANRKPRRRVFLDIQTLQEELDALRNVIDSQQKLLGNYRDLTAPRLSETMNSARENLYPLESQHIEKLMAGLSQRDFEVRALLGRSQRLREQVKQSIEILEEGHGKAIRVFTIVTLFFLPLSFVSSFFGMNVADIRETKRNQPLFWSIALPVTLGVLAIAFLYGYKWDSMVGWFERLLDGIRESRKAQYKTVADTRAKQPLGLSRGSRQQEGKQTGAQTEKTSQWSWKQVEQDYLRFRMPKRTATSKTIGE